MLNIILPINAAVIIPIHIRINAEHISAVRADSKTEGGPHSGIFGTKASLSTASDPLALR